MIQDAIYWNKRTHAIIFYDSVPVDCIERMVMDEAKPSAPKRVKWDETIDETDTRARGTPGDREQQ